MSLTFQTFIPISNVHFDLAPASYAQSRIWLDEQIRLDPSNPLVAIYNIPFVYRLQSQQTFSVKQLQHALQLLVTKHLSLRTALIFNEQNNELIQRIMSINEDRRAQLFPIVQSTFETEQQLTHIMHNEKRNSQLFDLAQGLVFRCHIVHYKQIPPTDLISHKDLIIFNFHHATFDYPSMHIFLTDLNQAYTTGQLSADNGKSLRYLDCNYQQSFSCAESFFSLSLLCRCCDRTRNANDWRKHVLVGCVAWLQS